MASRERSFMTLFFQAAVLGVLKIFPIVVFTRSQQMYLYPYTMLRPSVLLYWRTSTIESEASSIWFNVLDLCYALHSAACDGSTWVEWLISMYAAEHQQCACSWCVPEMPSHFWPLRFASANINKVSILSAKGKPAAFMARF